MRGVRRLPWPREKDAWISQALFGKKCIIEYLRVFFQVYWVKTLLSPKTLCYTTIPFPINTSHWFTCLEEREILGLICSEDKNKSTTNNSISTMENNMLC